MILPKVVAWIMTVLAVMALILALNEPNTETVQNLVDSIFWAILFWTVYSYEKTIDQQKQTIMKLLNR